MILFYDQDFGIFCGDRQRICPCGIRFSAVICAGFFALLQGEGYLAGFLFVIEKQKHPFFHQTDGHEKENRPTPNGIGR
jgi:hypothetical protein